MNAHQPNQLFTVERLLLEIRSELRLIRLQAQPATKCDLKKVECNIMSAISDYASLVADAFAGIGTDVDGIVASVAGVASDVASLKDKINQLENNPGPITPEDQALLTASLAQVTATGDKLKSVAAALKALDDATAPTEVPVPA